MLPQANKWKQLKLFELPSGKHIHGKVHQQSNGRYRASINDGWWTATGRTEAEAIRNIKKRYLEELEKYARTP